MNQKSIAFRHSLRGRLLLFVVLPLLAACGAMITLRAVNAFEIARIQAQDSLERVAQHVASEIEIGNSRAIMAVEIMAFAQEESMFGRREETSTFLKRLLKEYPEFTATSLGYEPNADEQDLQYVDTPKSDSIGKAFDTKGRFIPYWYRKQTDNEEIDLTPLVGMESLYYDGCHQQYLEFNKALPMIAEPYVYEGKMIVEQTFPIIRDGRFAGVTGVDRSLKHIAELLAEIKEEHQADVILVSNRGNIIATSLKRGLRTKAIKDTKYGDLLERFYLERDTRHFAEAADPYDNKDSFFATAQVPTGDWLVVLKKPVSEIMGSVKENIYMMTGVAGSLLLLIIGLIIWVSSSVTRRIEKAMQTADLIASGNLNVDISKENQYPDEIGSMYESFTRVVESYKQISDVCTAIAEGDFSRRLEMRSESDSLTVALNLMAGRRQAAEDNVRQYTQELESRTTELEEMTKESEERAALEASLSDLNAALRGNITPEEAARKGLFTVIKYLKAPAGALYISEDDHTLRCITSYAYPKKPDDTEAIEIGTGIIGQVAKSRQSFEGEPGEDCIRLSFGFGDISPSRISAYPLVANEDTVGVCELCLFKPLTDYQSEWLSKASEVLATTIRFAMESEERQLAEERTHLLLESTQEGIFGVDTEGAVIFINEAATEMLGYQSEDLLGKKVHPLIHHTYEDGRHYPVESCPMFFACNKGVASERIEEVLWKKGETSCPVEYSATPIHRASGELLGGVVVFRDITERRIADQELKEARIKAEDATKAKSNFLANMSHEIRTPLNGILGMTDLALDTKLDPEQRDYLTTVKTSADALLTLINDILDFSKIEAGRLELEPIDFVLRDSLAEMLNTLANRAHTKGLELVYDVPAEVHDALIGDVYRVRQVIVNLVGNAIKFTEKGEIVVGVQQIEKSEKTLKLQFSVKDTGIGIPQEKIDAIFRPFEQADVSTTRKFGGTGLGLAISVQLVSMMNGRIWAESEESKGSTFHFTAEFEIGTAVPTPDLDEQRSILGNLPVLIVDDNETNRRILRDMLRNWDMAPQVVSGGVEALTVLDRAANAGSPFKLVLSDVNMPNMDGFTLFEKTRGLSQYDHIPFVLLTSASRSGDVAKCREIGVSAHLIKPVKQSLLLNTIVNVVAGDKLKKKAVEEPSVQEGTQSEKVLHILLAEDNAINQKFATRAIGKAGHTFVVAQNGQEAVDAWKKETFDVVLMDVQMPVMDGFSATQAIRTMESEEGKHRHTPIIAMTANAMKGDKEKCLEAGMDGYVSKPIKRETMFAEIDRVLGTA